MKTASGLANFFLQQLYPKRLFHRSRSAKTLYLTFDDGPTPEITAWVLAQLKRYNAGATFFCVGQQVKMHPGLFQKILQNGHSVGNHGFHHKNGFKTKKAAYVDDVLKSENHIKSKFYRPPYGRMRFSQAAEIEKAGYQLVMWDVLSKDYDQSISAEKCWKIVKKTAQNGSIIVFHDSQKAQKNLKALLPKVLEHFSNEGFDFASL